MKAAVRLFAVLLIWSASIAFAQDDHTGETILLRGRLVDTSGEPIEGAVVEIWQTDAAGHYNHPDDATESDLDPNFQYFGTATTDANGNYDFLTIKPAAYGNRPSHIHVKVKIDGEEVLTTQWYFEEDRDSVEGESVFSQAGDAGENLILPLEEETDEGGTLTLVAPANIVLDLNTGGELAPTPAQSEGPYYPVIDFSTYDNDLTTIGEPFTLLNLNTATSDDFMTIPGMGNRMVREFEEYRPYISIEQFRREIGKYVDETQVAAYEEYVYVPVSPNESDAATLMQIPGVTDEIAAALIAARPYESNAAFLEVLGEYIDDVSAAEHYLVAE